MTARCRMDPSSASISYALEPIVACEPHRLAKPVWWWELLYRGRRPASAGPATPAEWRDWYGVLPELLGSAMQARPALRVSINFSTYQLLDAGIRERIVMLARWGRQLALEWTEHPLEDLGSVAKREAARFLRELRRSQAVVIGIDDLGAGDDGLGRIVALGEPPDFVKFDGAVLHAGFHAPRLQRLLKSQVDSYRTQGIAVVGEWVESKELHALARWLGMNFLQGFLFPGVAGTTDVTLGSVGRHVDLPAVRTSSDPT